MVITDVDAIPIEVDVQPLEEGGLAPYATSQNKASTKERTLIRLETSEGIVGWGEMKTLFSRESTESIIETFVSDTVTGKEIWEIQSFVDDLTSYTGYVHNETVIGGVEMAMWDALGKHLDAPVHKLLGGKTTDTVEFAYCVGILDEEESRQHARRAREMGFTALKTKAGGYERYDRTIQDDVQRLVAMDDAVDSRLQLRVDANQSWTPEETVQVGAKLEDAGTHVQYFEQPIRIDNAGTYKRLRERLRTPIGVNEDLYFPGNFYELLKADAVDIGVVDLVPAGGITALKRLAGVAHEANVSLAHHSAFDLGIKTAAVLHAVSTTPAINLASDTVYYAMADRVIESPFEFRDGELPVPDGAGLGVEVDESMVEHLRLD